MQIPIYNEYHEIISVEDANDNLNIVGGPCYLNEGCNMGLIRIQEGEYKGVLAILYEDEIHPNSSHGELISDHDAWELCFTRGKTSLIEELEIDWHKGILK